MSRLGLLFIFCDCPDGPWENSNQIQVIEASMLHWFHALLLVHSRIAFLLYTVYVTVSGVSVSFCSHHAILASGSPSTSQKCSNWRLRSFCWLQRLQSLGMMQTARAAPALLEHPISHHYEYNKIHFLHVEVLLVYVQSVFPRIWQEKPLAKRLNFLSAW